MTKLYLKDIKLIIITSEFRDAVLSKKLLQVKDALLKYTGDAKSFQVIEIDEYLEMDSTFANIKKLSCLVAGTTIAITLLDNALYMKKFHNSVLHNVMKYIYKISIVSCSWVDDMLVKSGIGKAEMKFNSMLTYVLSFKSCVINSRYLPCSTVAQREMLMVLLNVFDVGTTPETSNPLIDNEVILVDDQSASNDLPDCNIAFVELTTLIKTLSTFVQSMESKPVLKNKKILVSDEIKSFTPFYILIKEIIESLGGKEVENFQKDEVDGSFMTLEHNVDVKIPLQDTSNRCSLFYLFDRWGLNCDNLEEIDSSYKFSYHFPFFNNNFEHLDKLEDDKIAGLTGFFGYHKFLSYYFLKKLNIKPSRFLSKKYWALIAYVETGDKYNFAKAKNMYVVTANELEKWYANGEILAANNTNQKSPFLTYKIDTAEFQKKISQICSETNERNPNLSHVKLIEPVQPITETVKSPQKDDYEEITTNEDIDDIKTSISSNSSAVLTQPYSNKQNNNHIETLEQSLENNCKEGSSKNEFLPKLKQNDIKPSSDPPTETKKRELTVEQETTSKRRRRTETKDTTIDNLRAFSTNENIIKTIDERIFLAGGNNANCTFQNTGKKINVIFTGLDLKIDSTNTNFVYMSSIKNKNDLYHTNMYILDKMGLNVLENKDFENCECMIVGKKTASFYESLSYGNITHYLTFDFILSILEKVYRRKKSIGLNLDDFAFKELGQDIKSNYAKLNGKKLFESVNIRHINLLNPKNSAASPDPKESVFKAHGIETVKLINFDSDFNIHTSCVEDTDNYKILVINNTIKNTNPIMTRIRKQITENNSCKYLVVTWDFIMRSLLNMQVSINQSDRGILLNSADSY